MTRIRRDRSSPHYNQFQRYTTKEHRNSILKLRCKSKRGDPRSGEDERSEPFDGTWRPERRPLSKFSDNLADAGIIISTCK